MRFITDLPPPTSVETWEDVERCLHHCYTATLLGVDTETLGKGFTKMQDQVVYMGYVAENLQHTMSEYYHSAI